MITKDNIEDLIEFGGLLVHEVEFFDTISWKNVVVCRTFNEEYALKKLKSLQTAGFETRVMNYFVHFNYKETSSEAIPIR